MEHGDFVELSRSDVDVLMEEKNVVFYPRFTLKQLK